MQAVSKIKMQYYFQMPAIRKMKLQYFFKITIQFTSNKKSQIVLDLRLVLDKIFNLSWAYNYL